MPALVAQTLDRSPAYGAVHLEGHFDLARLAGDIARVYGLAVRIAWETSSPGSLWVYTCSPEAFANAAAAAGVAAEYVPAAISGPGRR